MYMLPLTAEQRNYVSDEIRAQRARGWLLAPTAEHPEAMLLWGTIGYAAFLSHDGRVWIDEEFTARPPVRPATHEEAIDAITKGRERHPALASLIPPPPAGAIVCGVCGGLGRLPNPPLADTVFCGSCDARGWLRPRTG